MPWHVAGGDPWLSWAEVRAYREAHADLSRQRARAIGVGGASGRRRRG